MGEPLTPSDNQRAADDRQDAARVLAGDTRAFEGIVRRWQSPLINLAYRFCRDRGRAEDMAQEAFLRAFRNLASWRQESAFSTWLFALATNLYCTELRRLPPIALPFDEVHEPTDPRAIDGGLEQRNQSAAIHKAVQTLRPVIARSSRCITFTRWTCPPPRRASTCPRARSRRTSFAHENCSAIS